MYMDITLSFLYFYVIFCNSAAMQNIMISHHFTIAVISSGLRFYGQFSICLCFPCVFQNSISDYSTGSILV